MYARVHVNIHAQVHEHKLSIERKKEILLRVIDTSTFKHVHMHVDV